MRKKLFLLIFLTTCRALFWVAAFQTEMVSLKLSGKTLDSAFDTVDPSSIATSAEEISISQKLLSCKKLKYKFFFCYVPSYLHPRYHGTILILMFVYCMIFMPGFIANFDTNRENFSL